MSTVTRSLLMAAAVTALAAAAQAHEVVYTATLTGPAEAPPNSSPGFGTATITMDLDLITMRIQTQFSGLIGNVTASHIHGPTATPGAGTAGVATTLPTFPGFPLGGTSGSYDQTFDMTLASSYSAAFITASGGTVGLAYNRLLLAMEQGRTYLNIHTSAFPGGEIRGFLVPAPGAFGALAMTGLLAARRRRA